MKQFNSRASLVKEITHIHWKNLTELRMYGNQMESLEELPRVSMLCLEQLSLGIFSLDQKTTTFFPSGQSGKSIGFHFPLLTWVKLLWM